MNDERLRDAYRRGLPAHDDAGPLDDVSAERLRRLVEQEGSETERLRTLDLALARTDGRRELDIVWGAARAARPQPRRWRQYVVAAAVVIVAVGLLAKPKPVSVDSANANATSNTTLRSAESPITLVGPVGPVPAGRAARFVWRPVGNAERYTLVVVDTTGTEVFATETRDTSLAVPDSVRMSAGHAYLWWVQARLADQSTVTAVTQRFTVR